MLTKEEILEKHWPCDTYIGRAVIKGKVIEDTFHEDKCHKCANEEYVYAAMEEYANQDKWIKTEDQLPKTNCDVLVLKRNGRVFQMSYHAPFDSGKRIFQWWGFGKWIDQHSQVTHWMKLPNPPKQ